LLRVVVFVKFRSDAPSAAAHGIVSLRVEFGTLLENCGAKAVFLYCVLTPRESFLDDKTQELLREVDTVLERIAGQHPRQTFAYDAVIFC
jgi:hypothetical protein